MPATIQANRGAAISKRRAGATTPLECTTPRLHRAECGDEMSGFRIRTCVARMGVTVKFDLVLRLPVGPLV